MSSLCRGQVQKETEALGLTDAHLGQRPLHQPTVCVLPPTEACLKCPRPRQPDPRHERMDHGEIGPRGEDGLAPARGIVYGLIAMGCAWIGWLLFKWHF